jgi:glycosyltransferase involved in cell wall biosynthesis
MPNGLRKLRQFLWLKGHSRPYRAIMRGSSLALLQGATVFEAYRNIAPNPQQVLNVQITDADRAPIPVLRAKQLRAMEGEPLRISYAGRMISMKGPQDWLNVLRHLERSGVAFEATWLGEGPLRPVTQKMLNEFELQQRVNLPGGVERDEVREVVERSDIFLFCHKTQESPRCLLEAIALGTPLVGYDSLHARNLIATNGGGRLVQIDDVGGLVSAIQELAGDRAQLAQMMADAHSSAMTFDRGKAISRRIELIKEFLGG